jgi:hypothetical protein
MRTKLRTRGVMAVVITLLAIGSRIGAQSLTYTKGQNVAPAYEGWEQDADGSKWFVFGYMNRNWVEEIDLPPGPDNTITPGGPDLGQPTHFLPRRNRFVFRVAVPKNFSEKDEMIWTLTAHGTTEKAWATLRPDYLLDNVVKASETGALGAGTSSPEVRSNQPPAVKVESANTVAKVGQSLTLTATVKDDGIPKPPAGANPFAALFGGATRNANGEAGGGSTASAPAPAIPPGLLKVFLGQATPEERAAAAEALGVSETQLQLLVAARRHPELNPPGRITVGKTRGLHLSWFVYRGAGKVTFSPEQIKTWEDTRAGMNSPWAPLWAPPRMPADGKIVVQATFAEPGTYVLKALADDGALLGEDVVTVTVTK